MKERSSFRWATAFGVLASAILGIQTVARAQYTTLPQSAVGVIAPDTLDIYTNFNGHPLYHFENRPKPTPADDIIEATLDFGSPLQLDLLTYQNRGDAATLYSPHVVQLAVGSSDDGSAYDTTLGTHEWDGVSAANYIHAPWGLPDYGPKRFYRFRILRTFAGDSGSFVDSFVKNFLYQAAPPASEWIASEGGIWSSSSNWNPNIPNSTSAIALFGAAITAPQTVTVDAPHTVKSLKFDNANSYTVGGPGGLTFDRPSGSAGVVEIIVSQGSHTVSTPLSLNRHLHVTVGPGTSKLTVAGEVTAPTSGIVKYGDGVLEMTSVRAESITVAAGTVTVTANGTNTGMSRVQGLGIASEGSLDLADNDLLVDYGEGSNPYEAVRSYVHYGYMHGSGGIISSTGVIAGDKIHAPVDNAELGRTEWNADGAAVGMGEAIDLSTVILKYTYFGDANLDGRVTSDDYVAVDVGLGIGDSWVQGDFNFSGTVTSDDYVAIDVNLGKGTPTPLAFAELKAEMIALHTAMFGESYLLALAAAEAGEFVVPEPNIAIAGVLLLAVSGRRRRRVV